MDDAIAIVGTCKKLEPDNPQVDRLLNDLRDLKLGKNVSAGQLDYQKAFNEVNSFIEKKETARAAQLLDQIIGSPGADANVILTAAKFYVQIADVPRFEAALEKLTKLAPDSPEAWFDLAGVKAIMNKAR